MNSVLAWKAQTQTPQTPKQSPGSLFLCPALLMGMIVFMILSSRSQKKRERREKEDMYGRLAKNDRVLTIGGVVGTIVSVKDDQVVVKVDESTNTKMTFMKSAIQKILSDDQSLSTEKK